MSENHFLPDACPLAKAIKEKLPEIAIACQRKGRETIFNIKTFHDRKTPLKHIPTIVRFPPPGPNQAITKATIAWLSQNNAAKKLHPHLIKELNKGSAPPPKEYKNLIDSLLKVQICFRALNTPNQKHTLDADDVINLLVMETYFMLQALIHGLYLSKDAPYKGWMLPGDNEEIKALIQTIKDYLGELTPHISPKVPPIIDGIWRDSYGLDEKTNHKNDPLSFRTIRQDSPNLIDFLLDNVIAIVSRNQLPIEIAIGIHTQDPKQHELDALFNTMKHRNCLYEYTKAKPPHHNLLLKPLNLLKHKDISTLLWTYPCELLEQSYAQEGSFLQRAQRLIVRHPSEKVWQDIKEGIIPHPDGVELSSSEIYELKMQGLAKYRQAFKDTNWFKKFSGIHALLWDELSTKEIEYLSTNLHPKYTSKAFRTPIPAIYDKFIKLNLPVNELQFIAALKQPAFPSGEDEALLKKLQNKQHPI